MNYSIPLTEKDACAYGQALPISRKHTVELCSALRNKRYEDAKAYLERVIKLKEPVPFIRFKYNVGHRKGPLAAGRYPTKASKFVLQILNSAAANATNKGFSIGNLIVKHITAHSGPTTMRYGRHRGRAKRTNLQVILTEKQEKPKSKNSQKKQEAKI